MGPIQGQSRDQAIKQSLGMTSAISLAGPTPIDVQRTKEMEEAIKIHNESEQELFHRMEILSKLNALVKEWIKEVSINWNMPESVAEQVGGVIYTFGSYRLGVHQKGADIDALCIAPQHVQRSQFFTSFFEKLKSHPEVSDLRAIEEAYVPVIKMNFKGIQVDMPFARLAFTRIEDTVDIKNIYILRNLDEKCVRSLNGCRTTDEIGTLVPNIKNFQLALRTIKLWAKTHGIYSNVMGYLGGVSWAILVARTCQLYPNAAAATLVQKFFLVFSQWKWPLPVLLKRPDDINLGFKVWDPKVNVLDRNDLMPIITPAYPQQNSTFNVSLSTRTVMEEELKQGLQTMNDIIDGNCGWERLFEAPNFFLKHKSFIVLIASSTCMKDQLEWSGLVESKVRCLVGKLELNQHIVLAHVNPECHTGIPPPPNQPSRPTSMWFIGLVFAKTENISVDLTYEIQHFTEYVYRQAATIRMLKKGMHIEARFVRRKELSAYLPEHLLERERKVSTSSTSTASVCGSTLMNSAYLPGYLVERERKVSTSSTSTASVCGSTLMNSAYLPGYLVERERKVLTSSTSTASVCGSTLMNSAYLPGYLVERERKVSTSSTSSASGSGSPLMNSSVRVTNKKRQTREGSYSCLDSDGKRFKHSLDEPVPCLYRTNGDRKPTVGGATKASHYGWEWGARQRPSSLQHHRFPSLRGNAGNSDPDGKDSNPDA